MILNKQVEVVVAFNIDKKPKPERIRVFQEDRKHVIKIDKIISFTEEGFKNNRKFVYECSGQHQGKQHVFVLKYSLADATWTLYRWD